MTRCCTDAPEALRELMYICAVYPRERKSYGSFLLTNSTMSSLKTKDVNLKNDREFACKAHFQNDSLQKCRNGSSFELCPLPPEITGTSRD